MQILYLSLVITLIQLYTRHYWFFLDYFNLIFSSLYVSVGFNSASKSHYNPSISYSFVTNIDSYFNSLGFHLFSGIFFIFRQISLSFLPWCLSCSISIFQFFNNPISFLLAPNVIDITDWEQPTSFATLYIDCLLEWVLWCFSLFLLFICYIHVSFLLVMCIRLLRSAKTMGDRFVFLGSCFRNTNYKIIPYFSSTLSYSIFISSWL